MGPYGVDQYRKQLGPSPDFDKAGYIFVNQDVRGRYMSEGTFVEMRPHIDNKKSKQEVDDSQRSLRHHRLAAEERAQQQWERRHLGHFLSRVFHFGQHHRLASGAEGSFAAGSHDRSFHG